MRVNIATWLQHSLSPDLNMVTSARKLVTRRSQMVIKALIMIQFTQLKMMLFFVQIFLILMKCPMLRSTVTILKAFPGAIPVILLGDDNNNLMIKPIPYSRFKTG